MACSNKSSDNFVTLSPDQFQAAIEKAANPYLLDVRKLDEYAQGHIVGAHPMNWLDAEQFKTEAQSLPREDTIFVYCRSGKRSGEASEYLSGLGYNIVNLDGGILGWEQAGKPVVNDSEIVAAINSKGIPCDSFTTPDGRTVNIFFVKHASLIVDIDGYLTYVDPVTVYGNDYAGLPKADLILVTHSHYDHLDPKAIDEVNTDKTLKCGGGDVAQINTAFKAVAPGETVLDKQGEFTISTTAAYNTTPDHLQYHPKERRDVGYILDIDGMRIYIAGDTEDIPEMADLGKIDIAFIPVNQPFTMTPEQAIHATDMIHPAIFYPYHYGDTDLTPLVEHFKSDPNIDVRVRQLQ